MLSPATERYTMSAGKISCVAGYFCRPYRLYSELPDAPKVYASHRTVPPKSTDPAVPSFRQLGLQTSLDLCSSGQTLQQHHEMASNNYGKVSNTGEKQRE